MSRKNVVRMLAGTGGVLLLAGATGPGAAAVSAADSGDVQATVRKTVLQTASPTGEIITSRMYTQVTAVGQGTKTVLVPVGTTSNRNLNEFGAFPMDGESIQFDLTVDGGEEQRTLTDADINPMEVSVTVTLDGVQIQPEDVVGASGVLDVQYTVRNTTAKTVPLTFNDVEGNEITEDVETAEPFAGSLDVTLPKGFNEVSAPGATIAGNGQNGTQLGYTVVLFPPLGAPEVTIGYQARIDGGVMPPADFAFLPIVPFDNSTIAGTTEAYKGGAATGAAIFDAGTQIGDNLLKLQAGASQLVAGLGQLSAGATQLSDGLVNTAVPGADALASGSAQVADGLNELNGQVPALEDGVNQLDAGANQLSDGLNELDSKVPALEDGADQLDDGAQQLSGGLGQLNGQVPALAAGTQQLDDGAQQLAKGAKALNDGLALYYAGVEALPASVKEQLAKNEDYQKLFLALDGIIAGIGAPDAPGTLLYGVRRVSLGLSHPAGAAGATDPGGVKEVVDSVLDELDKADPADPGAKQALLNLQTVLGCPEDTVEGAPICTYVPPVGADPTKSITTKVTLQELIEGLGSRDVPGQTALYGLTEVVKGIGDAATADTLLNGMKQIELGLSHQAGLTGPNDPGGIQQVTELVRDGIPVLIDKLLAQIQATLLAPLGDPDDCDPNAPTLRCGSTQLLDGTEQLAAGTAELNGQVPLLAEGVSQLAAGGEQLADGTSALSSQVPTLADGVNQLAEGGDALADGTGELDSKLPALASGVQQLDDGAVQVADGNQTLAEGLTTAADGSEQLADGLTQAEPGGVQIEEGAGQLKLEGADALATTGQEAQVGYARDVALLQASQQAGLEGTNLPFGAATGTDVVTTAAVQMQLAGIAPDTENNALKFGLGALLIAGAGGVAYAARRKVIA